MNKTYKVTDKQFTTFKKYVQFWQKKLGLLDWHIYVNHKELEDGAYANCVASTAGRGATINLNTTRADGLPTDRELKETALHEVLHILTRPLLEEGQSRYADEYTIDAAEHSIVTRLTNILMGVLDE